MRVEAQCRECWHMFERRRRGHRFCAKPSPWFCQADRLAKPREEDHRCVVCGHQKLIYASNAGFAVYGIMYLYCTTEYRCNGRWPGKWNIEASISAAHVLGGNHQDVDLVDCAAMGKKVV